MLRRLALLLVLLLAGVALHAAGGFAQDRSRDRGQNTPEDSPPGRIALVVGQGAYREGELPTAVNDAGLVAQALTSAGFEVVQGRDLGANDLRQLVRDFLDRVDEATADRADATVAVYLSGHALQIEGDNYLLPVDARIERDSDVPIEGFRISDLIRSLAATPAQTRIVMVDAAREYPLSTSLQPVASGLALVEPPAGFLVAFSSAPNTVAPEARPPYGPYATAFVEVMREPGLPVDEVFAAVRLRVHEETQGQQTPWHDSNLQAAFVFFEPTEEAAAEARAEPLPRPSRARGRRIAEVPPEEAYGLAIERDTIEDYQEFLRAHRQHPLAPRIQALTVVRREAVIWRRTVTVNTREAYWTYLRRYPRGPHIEDSRRRLVRLSAPIAPPAEFTLIEYEGLPPPLEFERPIEVTEIRTVIRSAPPPPPPPIYLLPPVVVRERIVFVAPPPPLAVGLLPIPAPIALTVRARPPRAFRPWVAPITPRGAVYVPVAPPLVRDGRFVRIDSDRPDRTLPIAVPGQPGLREPIRPIGPRTDRPDRPDRPDLPGRADRPDRLDRLDRRDQPEQADRPDRPDRLERPDRPDRPERADRPDRPDRLDRPGRPDQPGRPDRPARLDEPVRPDRPDRSDGPDRPERPGLPNRLDRPDRPERADRPDRPDRPALPDRLDRPGRPDQPDRPARLDEPSRLDRPARPDRPNRPSRLDEPTLGRPARAQPDDPASGPGLRPGGPGPRSAPDGLDGGPRARPPGRDPAADLRPGDRRVPGADPALDERPGRADRSGARERLDRPAGPRPSLGPNEGPERPGRGQSLGPAARPGPAEPSSARVPGRRPGPADSPEGGPAEDPGGGGRFGPGPGGPGPIDRVPGGPGGGLGRQGKLERLERVRPIERPQADVEAARPRLQERAFERPDRPVPAQAFEQPQRAPRAADPDVRQQPGFSAGGGRPLAAAGGGGEPRAPGGRRGCVPGEPCPPPR